MATCTATSVCLARVAGGDLVAELTTAGRGDGVVPGAPPGRRLPPPGRDPATFLEALEGRVERSLLDREHRIRQELDLLGDRIAVERLDGQRLQDEHVERAFEELAPGRSRGFGHSLNR